MDKKCLVTMWKKFLEIFFPFILVYIVNRIVDEKIKERETHHYENDECLKHSLDTLHSMLDFSVQNMIHIKEKAKGIALGLPFISVILVFASQHIEVYDKGSLSLVIMLSILFTAFLYLSGSMIMALQAHEVGKIHYADLKERSPVVDEKEEKINILYFIEQNGYLNAKCTNFLTASFTMFRNGTILYVIFGILLLASKYTEYTQYAEYMQYVP